MTERDSGIAKATRRVEAANKEESEDAQQLNHLKLTAMKPLQEELERIAAQEMELDAAISGKGYTDAHRIQHPPRDPKRRPASHSGLE